MIDDVARFTARIAVEWTAGTAVYAITGADTTFGRIINHLEQRRDTPCTRHVHGSIDELRAAIHQTTNPENAIGLWYFMSRLTTPPFATVVNDRYPEIRFTSLDDYLATIYTKERDHHAA